jgi:hypothetical protein
MSNKLNRALVFVSVMQLVSLTAALRSEAKTLKDVLGRGLDIRAIPDGRIPVGSRVLPAFTEAVAQAVAQQIPLASVAPAFSYRHNPAVDTYERSTNVPGPLFSERALTLGEGQLNFSVGYAFVDFSELNGTDLDNIRDPAFQLRLRFDEAVPQDTHPPELPKPGPGQFLYFAPVFGDIKRTRIDLQAHVVVPTLRYGLTDRWDIGIAIPILNTFLRVRKDSVPIVDDPDSQWAYVGVTQRSPVGRPILIDKVGNRIQPLQLRFVKSRRARTLSTRPVVGSATGVGDIVLRSKYHFWKREAGGAALGLNLQLPTGAKNNFHGTGETHLDTFLYLSQVFWSRVEPHLNVGIDFNADDIDRSSFLYAVGTTLLLGKVGLVVDFIGRNEFTKLPVSFPREARTLGNLLDRTLNTCTAEQPCQLKRSREEASQPEVVPFPFFPEKIKRNDIINFSFGLRYALGESGSIFFGGVVPLNEDGFRAGFIPSGGIEYTF